MYIRLNQKPLKKQSLI